MRKPLKRIVSSVLAAVAATAMLAVSSSALKLCIGGKCYELTIPSGNCTNLTLSYFRPICTDTQQNTATPTPAPSTTTPAPSAPTSTPSVQTGGETAASAEAADVLAIVNRERASAGLTSLTMTAQLNKLAEIRAKEIVKLFSHTRPNGTSCFTVFKENGVAYRYAGENIAYGQTSAASVMNAWMGSSGHRANILGKNFGKIGIACYIANGRKYWVQIFSD